MVEPSTYTAIGWTLVSLAALAAALNQVDEYFKRRKDKPSAQEVQNASLEKFATIEQLREVRSIIRDLDKTADDFATVNQLGELKNMLDGIVEDATDRRREIYRLMDEHKDQLSKQITEVAAKMQQGQMELAVKVQASQTHSETQNQWLTALSGKLDRFLEKAAEKHDR